MRMNSTKPAAPIVSSARGSGPGGRRCTSARPYMCTPPPAVRSQTDDTTMRRTLWRVRTAVKHPVGADANWSSNSGRMDSQTWRRASRVATHFFGRRTACRCCDPTPILVSICPNGSGFFVTSMIHCAQYALHTNRNSAIHGEPRGITRECVRNPSTSAPKRGASTQHSFRLPLRHTEFVPRYGAVRGWAARNVAQVVCYPAAVGPGWR